MRTKLLIVDDSRLNRQLLVDELKDEYEIVEAENGAEALDYVQKHQADILGILTDIVMPVMDGVELLKLLHERKALEDFPAIVITSEPPNNVVEECFNYGISDFIKKPVNPEQIKTRVKRPVDLYLQKNEFKQQLEMQTKKVQMQYNLLQAQTERLKVMNEGTIEIMSTILEYRNTGDRMHTARLKGFVRILTNKAAEMYPEFNLTPERIQVITASSVLHDMGMVFIPDTIIYKPGKFTPQEREYMKSHTIRGEGAVRASQDFWGKGYVETSAKICRSHHERWDGSGYPDGLVGDDIPLEAQIVSVADTYDGLITESDYKKAYSYDLAFQMIIRGDCGLFPPKMMQVFRECRRDLETLAQSFEGKDQKV